MDDPTSALYLPEGSEYSIYYGDTYIYMTPEIFTGIMTGLFFIVTIGIGFSCLNGITNTYTFVSKMPHLGKEA